MSLSRATKTPPKRRLTFFHDFRFTVPNLQFTFPVLLFTFPVSLAFSHPDGAPPAHTGGFGEPGCSTCHFAGPEGETSVSLFDGANTVQVGETWELQLRIDNPAMKTLGLQASMRKLDGENQSVTALHWNPNDFKIIEHEGVDYVTHRQPLTADNGSVVVDLEWDVPDYPVTAVLNIAFVVGNDDESPLGDAVVLFERQIEVK